MNVTYQRNAKGEFVRVPPDLSKVVASVGRNEVVWSTNAKGRTHKVRYGFQVKIFGNDMDACHEFGECVRHWAECEGRFGN